MYVQRDSRKREMKENIYERKDMKFLTFIPFLTILLPALYSRSRHGQVIGFVVILTSCQSRGPEVLILHHHRAQSAAFPTKSFFFSFHLFEQSHHLELF